MQRQWVRWWLIAAAVVAGAMAIAPLAVRKAHERAVEARLTGLEALIQEHAEAAGVRPELVRAVVRYESSGDPRAESPVGAKGLMQVMPDAHADAMRVGRLPEGDLFEPAYNLRVGTTYLAHLLERFDGDTRLALAAYHMGPTRVAQLVRQHPDLSSEQLVAQHAGSKTRAYVQNVMSRL